MIDQLAEHCYGYGHWNAPYWFIGLEEGKGPKETADNLKRLEAWSKLQEEGLCDCAEFHYQIGERSWHGDKARLQATWRPLILLLKTAHDEKIGREELLTYQRTLWGSSTGDTCLIELSGLAAKSLQIEIDRESFRQKRIAFLKDRLSKNQPKLIVMYGTSYQKYWEQIAGADLIRDDLVLCGSTLVAFTPHPVARKRTNENWIELGKKIRAQLAKSCRASTTIPPALRT